MVALGAGTSQAVHRMKRRRDGRRLPGRLVAGLAVAALLSVDGSAARNTESAKPTQSAAGRLAGWLLVAAPGMPDPRFARTVIFMLQHNDGGALGLIVNRPIAVEPASKVLKRLDGKDRSIEAGRRVRIHYGGPVQPARGFFVHSSDYAGTGTVAVTGRVSVTGPLVILRALPGARGRPRDSSPWAMPDGRPVSWRTRYGARTGLPCRPTTGWYSTAINPRLGSARWTGEAPISDHKSDRAQPAAVSARVRTSSIHR